MGFRKSPTELLEYIVEYCPSEGLEALSSCCKAMHVLCKARMQEHRTRMQDNYYALDLTTGLSENYDEAASAANFLFTVARDLEDRMFYQSLTLRQGESS